MAAGSSSSQRFDGGALTRIAVVVSPESVLGEHLVGELRLTFRTPDGGAGQEVVRVAKRRAAITSRAQDLLGLKEQTSPSQLLFATLVLAAAGHGTGVVFRRHHVFEWGERAVGRVNRADDIDKARRAAISQVTGELRPIREAAGHRLLVAEEGEWTISPTIELVLDAPDDVREAAERVLRVRTPSQVRDAVQPSSRAIPRFFETTLQAELSVNRYVVACGMPGAGLRTLATRLSRGHFVEVEVLLDSRALAHLVSTAAKSTGSHLLVYCKASRPAGAEEVAELRQWLLGRKNIQVFVATRSRSVAASWAGVGASPVFVTGLSDEEIRALHRSRGVERELLFAGELGWRMADAVRHPAVASAVADVLKTAPTLDLTVVPYGPLPMEPAFSAGLRPVRDAVWQALPDDLVRQLLDAWAICERASTVEHLAEVLERPVLEVKAALLTLVDCCMVERRADRYLLDHSIRWLARATSAWQAYVARQALYLKARLRPSDRLRVDQVGPLLKDVQALLDALLATPGHDETILHLASSVDFVLGLRRSVNTGRRLIAAAVEAAVRAGDVDTERWMHYALSLHLKNSGDYDGAWRELERLVAMCDGSNEPSVSYQRVIAHEEMGAIRLQLGDLAEARRLLTGALEDSERLFLVGAATPRGMAITLTTCGNLEVESGSPITAFNYFDRAERLVHGPAPVGEEIGYAIEVARALHGKGTARFCVGDFAEAHVFYYEAYSIRRQHDLRHQFPRSLLRLAVTLDARGRTSEAEDMFVQAKRWATELNEARQVAQYHHWFGIYLARRGQRAEAEASFVAAAEEFRRLGRRLTLAKVEGLLRDLRAGRLESSVARHRY